jgi:hypothetical protein
VSRCLVHLHAGRGEQKGQAESQLAGSDGSCHQLAQGCQGPWSIISSLFVKNNG